MRALRRIYTRTTPCRILCLLSALTLTFSLATAAAAAAAATRAPLTPQKSRPVERSLRTKSPCATHTARPDARHGASHADGRSAPLSPRPRLTAVSEVDMEPVVAPSSAVAATGPPASSSAPTAQMHAAALTVQVQVDGRDPSRSEPRGREAGCSSPCLRPSPTVSPPYALPAGAVVQAETFVGVAGPHVTGEGMAAALGKETPLATSPAATVSTATTSAETVSSVTSPCVLHPNGTRSCTTGSFATAPGTTSSSATALVMRPAHQSPSCRPDQAALDAVTQHPMSTASASLESTHAPRATPSGHHRPVFTVAVGASVGVVASGLGTTAQHRTPTASTQTASTHSPRVVAGTGRPVASQRPLTTSWPSGAAAATVECFPHPSPSSALEVSADVVSSLVLESPELEARASADHSDEVELTISPEVVFGAELAFSGEIPQSVSASEMPVSSTVEVVSDADADASETVESLSMIGNAEVSIEESAPPMPYATPEAAMLEVPVPLEEAAPPDDTNLPAPDTFGDPEGVTEHDSPAPQVDQTVPEVPAAVVSSAGVWLVVTTPLPSALVFTEAKPSVQAAGGGHDGGILLFDGPGLIQSASPSLILTPSAAPVDRTPPASGPLIATYSAVPVSAEATTMPPPIPEASVSTRTSNPSPPVLTDFAKGKLFSLATDGPISAVHARHPPIPSLTTRLVSFYESVDEDVTREHNRWSSGYRRDISQSRPAFPTCNQRNTELFAALANHNSNRGWPLDRDAKCITDFSGMPGASSKSSNPLTAGGLFDIIVKRNKEVNSSAQEVLEMTRSNWTYIEAGVPTVYARGFLSCQVAHLTGFRYHGKWYIHTLLTNNPAYAFLPNFYRANMVETHRWDDAAQEFDIIPMALPPLPGNSDDRSVVPGTTTIMARSSGALLPNMFYPIAFDSLESLNEGLEAGHHQVQQVEDATTLSNVAILALPLLLTLIPVAAVADVSGAGAFAYALLSDILTALPMIVKGIELLIISDTSFDAAFTRVGDVLANRSNHTVAAETWATRCIVTESVRPTGIAFVVVASVLMVFGLALELFARMRWHGKKRHWLRAGVSTVREYPYWSRDVHSIDFEEDDFVEDENFLSEEDIVRSIQVPSMPDDMFMGDVNCKLNSRL